MHQIAEYVLGPGASWRELALSAVDIVLVGYVCFRVLLLIRGTRAVQVLAGLLLLGLAYIGAQWTGLETLEWLLGHFLTYSFLFGVIVLFQADIRRGLAQLGKGRVLEAITRRDRAARRSSVEAVVSAAVELSRRRQGALLVLERTAELSDLAESGVKLDAAAVPELFLSIFHPGGPLHDGAVVVRGGRVVAARCLLPLTAGPAAQDLGTRHRAALGLSEELDAAVVVVSEERGEISLAVDGELRRRLDEKTLRELLRELLVAPDRPAGPAGLPRRGPGELGSAAPGVGGMG